jgi:hypothetical protein
MGGLVCVFPGVWDGNKVGAVVAVIKGIGVNVGTCGVDVALAAITTGVAVKMDGVFVGGKNGVGGLKGPGWITQPLQDAKRSIMRMMRVILFISSPPHDCIPLCRCEPSAPLAHLASLAGITVLHQRPGRR